eukprot:s1482_g6.t1
MKYSFEVYHFVANGEFSSILTMAQMIQCLAFVLLVIKSCSQGSVAGISGKSLALEALAFACRLSSTTWLNGYLPVDASGDFVYQAVDLCSLLLVLSLLYRAYLSHRWSYEEEADSLPVLPMVAVCFLLAALLHADMNSRPLFASQLQGPAGHPLDGWTLSECRFCATTVVAHQSDGWSDPSVHRTLHRHAGHEPSFERHLHVARLLRHHLRAIDGGPQPRNLGHSGCSHATPAAADRFRVLLRQGGDATRIGLQDRAAMCRHGVTVSCAGDAGDVTSALACGAQL